MEFGVVETELSAMPIKSKEMEMEFSEATMESEEVAMEFGGVETKL